MEIAMFTFDHPWWREHQIAFSPGSCVSWVSIWFVPSVTHCFERLLLCPPTVHQVHRLSGFLWIFYQ